MTLSAANQARLEAALDKKYQFAWGISTFRESIAQGRWPRAEIVQSPAVIYSRTKFNRMTCHKAQAAYLKQCDTMKETYALMAHGDAGAYTVVPKMVYDYFVSQSGAMT
jgi:hypothetical protein